MNSRPSRTGPAALSFGALILAGWGLWMVGTRSVGFHTALPEAESARKLTPRGSAEGGDAATAKTIVRAEPASPDASAGEIPQRLPGTRDWQNGNPALLEATRRALAAMGPEGPSPGMEEELAAEFMALGKSEPVEVSPRISTLLYHLLRDDDAGFYRFLKEAKGLEFRTTLDQHLVTALQLLSETRHFEGMVKLARERRADFENYFAPRWGMALGVAHDPDLIAEVQAALGEPYHELIREIGRSWPISARPDLVRWAVQEKQPSHLMLMRDLEIESHGGHLVMAIQQDAKMVRPGDGVWLLSLLADGSLPKGFRDRLRGEFFLKQVLAADPQIPAAQRLEQQRAIREDQEREREGDKADAPDDE